MHASAPVPAASSREVIRSALHTADLAAGAMLARATAGLSPVAMQLALADWALHLAMAPGKRIDLALDAAARLARFLVYASHAESDQPVPGCIAPPPGDRRFRGEAWQQLPFRLWYQGFLLTQEWWNGATHDVPGVEPHHERVVAFAARQLLDILSPSNLPLMNPELIDRTLETGGRNLLIGARNLLEDIGRLAGGAGPVGSEQFRPGRDVAITPGKVIFRNRLIELIQYAPATPQVRAEPVLIVPAWIMKYYILDLSPQDSLIRHLVEDGHTVFCISWRNPDAADRDIGLDDYRRLGIMPALDAVGAVLPGSKVHAVGYCLGGTLLTIAAAAMARAGDDRLASLTLLAAQTDFTEPGELELFIDHSQVALLEGMMWGRGYLDRQQMAGAFQLLRSNDLVWSRMLREYLMGERSPMNDLMAWNADATRMPYRMHSEYLRHMFLENSLASGRTMVDGHPVAIQNIRVPIFAVGTEWDHVAPWHSVFKIHALSDTDVTFALTNGGHNAGIVSPPSHPRRHFRLRHKPAEEPVLGPEEWLATTAPQEGSWWPGWEAWLTSHSAAKQVPPPAMGAARKGYPVIADAPGTYVFQA